MARPPQSTRLFKKAEAALLSAIEIYNKPDFGYREETFTILMLNAWELLLKGKLVLDHQNNVRCLYLHETRTTKSGRKSTRTYVRRNRSGNVCTKSLGQVISALDADAKSRLPAQIKSNLDALTEIRDNAIHYFNASPQLAKQVLEIGTASVKNFIDLARRWYGYDLSGYGLYLMPIGFLRVPAVATAIWASSDEAKLVSFLAEMIRSSEGEDAQDFHVALEVNLSFKRSPDDAVSAVCITTDPNVPKVALSEEQIRTTYPWDYSELVSRLRRRYSDFKVTRKFHTIRKPLMNEPRYVNTRFLDPGNPKSSKKVFYNSNVLREFDKHYTRRS